MRKFWDELTKFTLIDGEIAIGWLGQSGFAFRDSKGTIVAIDVYLTDSAQRVWGLKRLMAPVVSQEEFVPDLLLATHFHEDHLDIDAMPTILNNGKTKVLSPSSSIELLNEIIAPDQSYEKFDQGDIVKIKGITLEAVYADHGDFVPDPIGVLIEMDGIKIYFCGDTAYRPKSMQRAISWKPDILIPPINGANGNLDSKEAAILANICSAKVVIPCHFWTFAEHNGDPQSFKDNVAKYAPETDVLMMCQGEIIKYSNR